MDLAACTAMGENNQCTSYVDLPQEEVTFRTPDDIKSIKWLTGAITAGLDWQYEAGAPIIRGFFPWSSMTEVGEKLTIENYNFEKTYLSDIPVVRTAEGVLGGRGDVYPPEFKPGSKWIKYPETEDNETNLSVEWDPASGAKAKENHVLLVNNMNDINQGATARVDASTGTSSNYVLSLKIKSSTAESQKVPISMRSDNQGPVTSVFGVYTLTPGWQDILSQPIRGVGSENTYVDIFVSEGSREPFYIDELEIKPVLEVQSGQYLERSCRLYPKDDSLTCEYYDDNGIYNKGWYGYCLERDSQNQNVCISWWPVDLLYGESNLFGDEEQAGYTGREPLYYCLETQGRVPYDNSDPGGVNQGAWCLDTPLDDTHCEWDVEDAIAATPYNFAVCYWGGDCDANQTEHINLFERYAAYSPLVATDPNYHLWEDEFYYAHADDLYNFANSWLREWDWYGSEMRGAFSKTYNNGGTVIISRAVFNGRIAWRMQWRGSDTMDASMVFQCVNPDGTNKNCTIDDRGRLIGYVIWGDDTSGDEVEGASWGLQIFRRDVCTQVVEVAQTGGEDMAWADRLNTSGYNPEGLNYSLLDTDVSPYGGTVTRDTDPEDWNSPLLAEVPNTYDYTTSPYQTRSGSPYACIGDCIEKTCSGGPNEGNNCRNYSDCVDATSTLPDGVCTGVGICSLANQGCDADTDCPPDEKCIGGSGSQKGSQAVLNWPNNTNPYYAEQRLRRLFAQSYGIWQWQNWDSEYVFKPLSDDPLGTVATDRWGPPNKRCPNDIRPKEDLGTNADYCGIPPKIRNIKLGDGSSNIAKIGPDGGKVRLSFNIIANREQQPIKTIYIDWGDGEVNQIPYDARAKDDHANPHVYTHAYDSCIADDCRINYIR
ncbi:MAG: hypothetical protein E4H31_02580, partial [Dehalococcoidia bacterium]